MGIAQPDMGGLSDSEVEESRLHHGNNRVEVRKESPFVSAVKGIALDPMFILLLAACIIYFVAGRYLDGFIMLFSIFIVAGISLYQKYRSENAIGALRKLSAPKSTVIRNGINVKIPSVEVVVGDILLLEEGEIISADGSIISAHDFSVNESLITGESLPVYKGEDNRDTIYRGTLATSGSAVVRVTEVGNRTAFGKIGLSLAEIETIKTPLQTQVNSFVKVMVWIGGTAFLVVIGINFYKSGDFIASFLQGLTLAMSILPEEIPVAFTTFQALGAFRLLRNHIVVKHPQYVETLGSATVICVDKTGTLTENKMSIEYVYDAISQKTFHFTETDSLPRQLIEYAMWSSETEPFDPMEKAIHNLYERLTAEDKRGMFEQVHEYPIGGKPPMMTHIFSDKKGETIIAAKGAPEAFLNKSDLSPSEISKVEEQLHNYARQGFRVLGVGRGIWDKSKWPASQEEFHFEFLGLVAFHDPPKPHIRETIQAFHAAGISVKMVTGDHAQTAITIANQIHLEANGKVLTGKQVLNMSTEELKGKSKHATIFARMFPEAKLRLVNALKENGEVVAMTGDGVNDAPALKAAHIGIAMGQHGSEVAKSTASLIITDDDLGHMTEAVALGRKIYDNLKKAIQYIVSIHIPIILIVTLPLLLAWKFTDIFSPVHVIFLELIMGPTCSIIYENEPMEPGTMQRPPRHLSSTFFSAKQLSISIVQGLVITIGCLGIGHYFMQQQYEEAIVRTVIFITLLFANIFLTLSNRSFRYPVFKTLGYKNYLVPLITTITLLFIILFLYVPGTRQLFLLGSLSISQLLACIVVALISTFWIELLKAFKKKGLEIS